LSDVRERLRIDNLVPALVDPLSCNSDLGLGSRRLFLTRYVRLNGRLTLCDDVLSVKATG